MNDPRTLPSRLAEVPVGRLAADLGLELRGDPDVVVSSVVLDDRRTVPGDLFAALPGAHVHGARFAPAALGRGARAVLTDPAGADVLADAGVPLLVAAEPRLVLGRLAALVHAEPASRMTTFGVTGTNGKTTTTFLLERLLGTLGRRTGLVGTVVSRYAGRDVPSRLTTPEAPELQGWLAAMAEVEVDALAMEVSSHALALHRVDGIVYDVVGFTNLSQDHLDFHGTLEEYLAVKASLFTPERSRRGVVVVDDDAGRRLAASAGVPVTTVATHGGDADWRVADLVAGVEGSRFTLVGPAGERLDAHVTMPGDFNVANAALAIVLALVGGATVADVADALARDGLDAAVPGRMEVLATSPRVVVDFAHNADALGLALATLRPTTPGRLVVVFGATGERDTGKRPVMGRVAALGADTVVVTDDDPHGEDPAPIRAAVLAGAIDAVAARAPGDRPAILEVAPRAEAVRRAVLEAGPDDTVLVAGRGHETVQDVGGVDIALDDRVEARAALAARPR
ncbi:UDP-N-acetylmuramoyl-L-alanyl-D-glutamate--2,6-diaminopimelate ligase [Sanguibacter sp. HDW7]|uniref:UDP-N-acetylmuramoyl-L-alanyl-D-glutamate--2, 6-diaminopimelate ligase n=1 Tax=Sanguibacter sp. HDW7 TaxID=2714931 RepID=UPI00140C5A0E|nr:UDP-N-acetylmuramoyl-L-alanyl-D-glutamate--2,6-diaminopimelate ligase [Sanguibacter sp. HDW7]QIK83306.1 UDP-N-acetylmuramoyl-L-alanyl-D-glutamate--2,6-diaminopimelate ligase [Sanguibacter sp. HDW7]